MIVEWTQEENFGQFSKDLRNLLRWHSSSPNGKKERKENKPCLCFNITCYNLGSYNETQSQYEAYNENQTH